MCAIHERLAERPRHRSIKCGSRRRYSLCDQRRQFDLQSRMHFWLHAWLGVHVALSVALTVLMIVHAVLALEYL